ncbi:MAG: FtsX-like permease family protein [Rudaea sp.]|uniref:ABC transporter permease n=1 Tax=Rudaea sp. TaxID=2136325 RepID=UPI0039E2C693
MEIRPILSALMRSKVAMILIGLQVALTLAILCNALFIIRQRVEKMQRPTGMNETDTFLVNSTGFGEGFNVQTTADADLAVLRSLPGVVDATMTNSMVPLGGSGWSSGVNLQPEQKTSTAQAAYYMLDDHAIDAYGMKLVSGRNFKPEEVAFMTLNDRKTSPVLIVTHALAEKLFPGGDALGKTIYDQDTPSTIVGIVDRLQVPWLSRGDEEIEYSAIWPTHLAYGNGATYLIRAEPGRRDELMKTVEAKLGENKSRIVRSLRSEEKVRADAYADDRAMSLILGGVIVALLTITALGIVGMASFWVAQRTKQIGTRRALGATKFDILRYFLTENFVITTLGLLVGGVLTYALSLWLLTHTDGAKLLPWYYVPVGFACLWLLGQVAVLGPATRASRVPPAVATRSV